VTTVQPTRAITSTRSTETETSPKRRRAGAFFRDVLIVFGTYPTILDPWMMQTPYHLWGRTSRR
jgi:hypothetical protein